MATPIFACGAECGVNAIGALQPTGTLRHWSTMGAQATPVPQSTVTGSGGIAMSGARCWHLRPTGGSGDVIEHLFATAIASPASMVIRFKLEFTQQYSTIHSIVSAAAGLFGIRYNPTGSKLEAWAGAATTTIAGSFVPSLFTIYHVEVRFTRGTTNSTEWRIDGVDQTTASKTGQVAGTLTGFKFGHQSVGSGGSVGSGTGVSFIDDILVSGTSADYDDAAFTNQTAKIIGLFPNSDGIHVFNANDFAWPTAAGTKSQTATDAWTALKASAGGGADGQALISTIGEFISQVVINTSGLVEIGFESIPAASSINVIGLVSEHHGSTTGAHGQTLLFSSDHAATLFSGSVFSGVSYAAVTVSYNSIHYPTIPSGPSAGSPWTKAIVDNLVIEWGRSGDVIGNPIIDGVCLEVDYIPDAGSSTTLTTVTFTLTPVALTTSVGNITVSISPVIFTLTPVGLNVAQIPSSGLVGWWDFSDTSSFTLFGSNEVSGVNGQGGTVPTLIQGSFGLRPITGTRMIGGKNALDFDGADDYLLSTDVALQAAQPFTMFVVAQNDDGANSTTQRAIGSHSTPMAIGKTSSNIWGIDAGSAVTGGTADTNSHLLAGVFNGISSQLRVDRILVATGDAGTGNPDIFFVVGANVGASELWDGMIGEVVVYHRVLTAPEIMQVETYLNTKWFPPSISGTLGIVIITLTPVVLTTSVGTVSLTLGIVTATLIPVALITSIGTVSRTLGVVTVALTPVALTASVGTTSRTLGVVTVTFTPIALVASIGTVSRTLGIVTTILTPVALTTSVGNTIASISPVVFSLTPVALTGQGIASQVSSIAPVIITLNPQLLTSSVGTASRTLGVITVILTPIVLTVSVGTTSRTLGVITVTFTPVALSKSVGGVTSSILPVLILFNPQSLTTSVGTTLRTLGAITVTLTPVALTILGTTTTTLSPVTFTLTIPTLTYLVGTSARTVSPVILTFTPVGLTKSIGDVSTSLGIVIFTLIPVQLVRSVGNSSRAIDPINLMLTIVGLTGSSITGGKPKVWMGTEWVEKPVKVWMGSVWVEKPMKVWTGSEWELV